MSNKRDEIMKNLYKQAERIDRNEEHRAKKKFEKKPRAVRRYEKFANMGDETNKRT